MKTTVDIDDPILKELKALQEKQGESLGRVISDLLRRALHLHPAPKRDSEPPRWISRAMRALVDLADKTAVFAAMER